jgi:hypothetical protein
LRYRTSERRIFPLVARVILKRQAQEPNSVFVLSGLFNPYTEANKLLIELFDGDLGVLKQAYFALSTDDRHDDYDGRSFSRILDVDPGFLREYIDARYRGTEYLSQHDDTRDYAFLWKRPDYHNVGMQLVEHIYSREWSHGTSFHGYLRAFIHADEDEKVEPTVAGRQDEVLRELINLRHADAGFMSFLFGLIAGFPPDRRRPFLAHLLQVNQDFELFECLNLVPAGGAWCGSAVPMYQKKLDYLESLLPLVDTASLLKHKQLLERQIEGLRKQIEREKKADFLDFD